MPPRVRFCWNCLGPGRERYAAQDLQVAGRTKCGEGLSPRQSGGCQVVSNRDQFVWIRSLVAISATVEVIVYKVAVVPSLLTVPLMLRSPSVAGAHGRPVDEFVPV